MFEGRSANSGESANHSPVRGADHDNGVTPGRIWLLRAAIVLSTTALLGTSDDGDDISSLNERHLKKSVEAPEVELTADEPRAQFLVKLKADVLGPDMVVTTASSTAYVNGNVGGTGAMGDIPQLVVSVADSDPRGVANGSVTVEAQKDFSYFMPLTFNGNCQAPESGDCSASFGVELSRSDEGVQGGTLRVRWSLALDATFQSQTGSGGSGGTSNVVGEPPWTVTITPL